MSHPGLSSLLPLRCCSQHFRHWYTGNACVLALACCKPVSVHASAKPLRVCQQLCNCMSMAHAACHASHEAKMTLHCRLDIQAMAYLGTTLMVSVNCIGCALCARVRLVEVPMTLSSAAGQEFAQSGKPAATQHLANPHCLRASAPALLSMNDRAVSVSTCMGALLVQAADVMHIFRCNHLYPKLDSQTLFLSALVAAADGQTAKRTLRTKSRHPSAARRRRMPRTASWKGL